MATLTTDGEVGINTSPDHAQAVLSLLTERFEELSPQLQVAARFIIDQPREVGVQSMRSLAAQADVHPNTLVRLAQAIGFDGYDSMRDRFRHFVTGDGMGSFRDRAEWLQTLARTGGSAELIADMATATSDNLEEMWRGLETEKLNRIADAILAARQVYVLGMGSAYSLGQQFWYVARMAFPHIVPIPRHGSHPIDDLATLDKSDVLIALTFQPYRSETMSAVRQAKEVGATVIGITDSMASPLARAADETLTAPTNTPHFFASSAATLAMLEGLVAVLVSRAGTEASEQIDAFHKGRRELGLYEEHPALLNFG